MIFGNINQLEDYEFLEDAVKECFAYAANHDLVSYKTGRHDIDDDRLFVNIVQYKTTTPDKRFWEAHRDYLDLHLMLKGPERIDLNFIENMEQKTYVPADDFLPLEGEKNGYVTLNTGDFLICLPKDAHRTAIKLEESVEIKKAIFKILIANKV